MITRDVARWPTKILLLALAALVATGTALAQDDDAPTLGITGLAQTTLASVGETPLYFHLWRVTVGGGDTARYAAADGMVYQLSGAQTITTDGRSGFLSAGQGTYVAGGMPVTFVAAAGEASVFLHFLLAPHGGAELPATSGAEVSEVFTGAEPLPGLSGGAYAFDLTLLEFPANYPINDPHYRTGGALYYVVSGSGELTADGSAERKPAGSAVLEPSGWVHQWANPHHEVTTVVVANISPEGGAAIVFGTP
jgi:mannose-6-phosphate isomerase-like protein (cupin superfamily)